MLPYRSGHNSAQWWSLFWRQSKWAFPGHHTPSETIKPQAHRARHHKPLPGASFHRNAPAAYPFAATVSPERMLTHASLPTAK